MMRRYAQILACFGLMGAACAAPDPVLMPEPDVTPAQVVVVEEPAGEADDAMGHNEDGDGMAGEDHESTETHHEEGTEHEDDHDHDAGDMAMVDSDPAGDFDVEVGVVFSEFSIDADALTFTPGQTVRFRLRNEGELDHEFRLSNQHRIDEHIAAGHEDHGDEEGHHGSTGDVVIVIPAGTSQTIDVTLPNDTETYTMLVCLLPGHYEAGMSVPIDFN